MNCQDCDIRCASFGTHRNGLRRFRCGECGKTYTEPHEKPLGRNDRPDGKGRPCASGCFLEGSSVRVGERITEIHRDTILRPWWSLARSARRSWRSTSETFRSRTWKSTKFGVHRQEGKARAPRRRSEPWRCYTFVAIERNTKLVLNIAMGKRDQPTTNVFVEGVRDAIAPGFVPDHDATDSRRTGPRSRTRSAITSTYAMLIKVYRAAPEGERRYCPAEVQSVEVVPVCGNPDPDRICTSIMERTNLSVRMGSAASRG